MCVNSSVQKHLAQLVLCVHPGMYYEDMTFLHLQKSLLSKGHISSYNVVALTRRYSVIISRSKDEKKSLLWDGVVPVNKRSFKLK